MAYPQAPIKMDMYMELPTGIHTKHENFKDQVLKLLANIYGKASQSRVEHLPHHQATGDQLQAVSY
jgi:hypothetical protein